MGVGNPRLPIAALTRGRLRIPTEILRHDLSKNKLRMMMTVVMMIEKLMVVMMNSNEGG